MPVGQPSAPLEGPRQQSGATGRRLGTLNRPGVSGGSVPWEGWSHVREYIEEVSGRAA